MRQTAGIAQICVMPFLMPGNVKYPCRGRCPQLKYKNVFYLTAYLLYNLLLREGIIMSDGQDFFKKEPKSLKAELLEKLTIIENRKNAFKADAQIDREDMSPKNITQIESTIEENTYNYSKNSKLVKVYNYPECSDLGGWHVAAYILKINTKVTVQTMFSDWQKFYAEIVEVFYKLCPNKITELDFVSNDISAMLKPFAIEEQNYIDLAITKSGMAKNIRKIQSCFDETIILKIIMYKANASKVHVTECISEVLDELEKPKREVSLINTNNTITQKQYTKKKVKSKSKIRTQSKTNIEPIFIGNNNIGKIPLYKMYRLSPEAYDDLLLSDCKLSKTTLNYLHDLGLSYLGETLHLSKNELNKGKKYKNDYYNELCRMLKRICDEQYKKMQEAFSNPFGKQFEITEEKYEDKFIN